LQDGEKRPLINIFKKVVFWTYPRTSWQWDVLCVLILVFIFLTPKSWFANTPLGKNETEKKVVLITDVTGMQGDTAAIERRIRSVPGRENAVVLGVREVKDSTGVITAYEVDIR
jgi:hypothetical protein